jgi:nitrile hydratase accessory protein
MTRHTQPEITDMEGPASLPRRSGELVFQAPWERKVFALAVTLCAQGVFEWEEFRARLIAAIATAEHAAGPHARTSVLPSYYESWLAALEQLLRAKGIVPVL